MPTQSNVWIVPPYNNRGWPEVAIFAELRHYAQSASRTYALAMPSSEHGDGFSSSAQFEATYKFVWNLRELFEGGLFHVDDVLLFTEALSPLAHIARVLAKQAGHGVGPRMVGMMHGGAAYPEDELALSGTIETSILTQFDLLLFPSVHARAPYYQLGYTTKLRRWPLPSQIFDVPLAPKQERWLVFPHREIAAKGIDLFHEVCDALEVDASRDAWQGRLLRGKDKTDLYREFAKSKAVFANATMETYGVAVEEAVVLGCCPVLNRHPVYVEMYPYAHWHDGTVDGVLAALKDVDRCAGHGSTRQRTHKRSEDLIEAARNAERIII